MKFGVIKPTEAVLIDHVVISLRLQCRNDISIPRIPDENATFLSVGRPHGFTDVLAVLHTIRTVEWASIGKVRAKAHFEIHDRKSDTPRRFENPSERLDHRLNRRYVNSDPVKQATFRAKLVLHIDHDHSGPRNIQQYGVGFGLYTNLHMHPQVQWLAFILRLWMIVVNKPSHSLQLGIALAADISTLIIVLDTDSAIRHLINISRTSPC